MPTTATERSSSGVSSPFMYRTGGGSYISLSRAGYSSSFQVTARVWPSARSRSSASGSMASLRVAIDLAVRLSRPAARSSVIPARQACSSVPKCRSISLTRAGPT